MIYHYLNLCCVDWLAGVSPSELANERILCDSLSLKLKLNLLGFRPKLVPGTSQCKQMRVHASDSSAAFLLPFVMPEIKSQLVLPVFSDPENDPIEGVIQFLSSASDIKIVYICISSPKQNLLARRLSKVFPEMVFFCVGGAISMIDKVNTRGFDYLVGSGLQWITFMFKDPKRGFKKILQTQRAFFSLRNTALLLKRGEVFEDR